VFRIPVLTRYRPDLEIWALNCPPTGLVAIRNLDRMSTTLQDEYQTIVAEYLNLSMSEEALKDFYKTFPVVDVLTFLTNSPQFPPPLILEKINVESELSGNRF